MTQIEAPVLDAPPPKRRGPLAILAGVLLWPRATFAYLRDFGRWSWVWPVVLVAGLALAARVVAMPIERAQAEAVLAAIEDQQKSDGSGGNVIIIGRSSGSAGAADSLGAAGNSLVDAVLPVAGVVWDWVFRGGLMFGLSWVMGGRPRFDAMLRMSGWTLVPNAARLVVALAVMLIAHRVPTPGLTGLLDRESVITVNTEASGDDVGEEAGGTSENGQPVFASKSGGSGGPGFVGLLQDNLLSSLDIYTLWGLLLTAIGAAVTARLSWLKAGLSTLVYWGLTLVLGVVPPLVMSNLLNVAGPSRGPLP
jgi:hypothetical protein